MTSTSHKHITEANQILISLGVPRAQQNEHSALCLLALLNLTPRKKWARAENQLIGITPIMTWTRENYKKEYAPNTRETFRRHTMHQFVDAGIALYNPDMPDRPVNSPKAVYQIEPATVELFRSFGTKAWHDKLTDYLSHRETLAARYTKERKQNRIPVQIAERKKITLSPGEHSKLIRAIIEEFGSRFVPGSKLIYAGDTGDKWGYFDAPLLAKLSIKIDLHGKMPDVVLYYAARNWLLLVWRPLQVMGPSMANDTLSWLMCLQKQRLDWSMGPLSQVVPLWPDTSAILHGKLKYGSPRHHHTSFTSMASAF